MRVPPRSIGRGRALRPQLGAPLQALHVWRPLQQDAQIAPAVRSSAASATAHRQRADYEACVLRLCPYAHDCSATALSIGCNDNRPADVKNASRQALTEDAANPM